ncbi:ketosteroid isomerase-like protein [Actinoplanes tereljensis]|uniref:SnoaL-like domain-containing protein n=1 Tax=Paractinoplanes tereljensis TaxID=571912 RepID=A0A919NUK5_9ACTN|nr:nuclear transport factor 2 family protein [Actinoplanes tereljensis]GIF25531.1 hypothetical protein Ate02nite_82610 [Actinoplanes tereljensis]
MSESVEAAVRALLGAHTQAQDAGRTDEVVALYGKDAVLEIPGMDPVIGHDALRAAFAGWAPAQPQKHLVGNTVITVGADGAATAVSDVVFFQRGEAGWQPLVVGRYDDTLRDDGDGWRFQRRITTYQA